MPCCGTNATGRCRSGRPPLRRHELDLAEVLPPVGAVDSMVIVELGRLPGRQGEPLGRHRDRAAGWRRASGRRSCSRLPVTLVAVRVVVSRPGMTGALIDGRLRCDGVDRVVAQARTCAAASRRTSGRGCRRPCRSTRPAPMSNGSAGVVRSSLTTSVIAVVISADLIWPGVQSGGSAVEQDRRAGDVRRRHRGAGDRLEVLAGRARRAASPGSACGRPGSARRAR